jgi:CheY-like chemotaxis protein
MNVWLSFQPQDMKQVLIVDDDVDDCELFCDAVTAVDDNVTCRMALDGQKALTLLQSDDYKPDYIFLDLAMPVLDGKNCLSEICKIESLKDVPVIIYTTSKRKTDKEEMKELGAVYFITKPTSLSELCSEISFVLDDKWRND